MLPAELQRALDQGRFKRQAVRGSTLLGRIHHPPPPAISNPQKTSHSRIFKRQAIRHSAFCLRTGGEARHSRRRRVSAAGAELQRGRLEERADPQDAVRAPSS